MKIFLFLNSVFVFLSAFTYANHYDPNQAEISVWLSGAAYCGKDNYSKMSLTGKATGFIVDAVLHDSKTDLQGFTGVLPSEETIYAVYRGSSSVLNWIDDMDIIKTKYLTYPECGCSVHKGFYNAATHLKNATISSIHKLYKKYNYKKIIVTGHSLGAAIAQLIGMELHAYGLPNQIYNFGQPRIGDNKYAGFVNTVTEDLWRFTHNKDPVPHVPPEAFGFLHSCVEVFEDSTGKLKTCSNVNCEDHSCADQFSFNRKDVSDHNTYLGHPVSCDESVVGDLHRR